MANELILAVDDEAHILELLSFNIPQRWSVAHLYQAICFSVFSIANPSKRFRSYRFALGSSEIN